MKIRAILIIAAAILGLAAVPSNTVTLVFTMQIDPNTLGGASASVIGSNFTAVIYSTTSVTTPTNQWPVVATIPAGPLISTQGPPGTLWTNQITTDTSTRFYLLQWTNTVNGGAGPFSPVALYYYGAPPGTVSIHN